MSYEESMLFKLVCAPPLMLLKYLVTNNWFFFIFLGHKCYNNWLLFGLGNVYKNSRKCWPDDLWLLFLSQDQSIIYKIVFPSLLILWGILFSFTFHTQCTVFSCQFESWFVLFFNLFLKVHVYGNLVQSCIDYLCLPLGFDWMSQILKFLCFD